MAKLSVYYLRWKHCPIRSTDYSRERWRGAQQMRRRAEEFLVNDHTEVDSHPYQHVLTVERNDIDTGTLLMNLLHEIEEPTESMQLNTIRVCRACHKVLQSVQKAREHVVEVHGRDEDDMLPQYIEPLRGIEVGDVIVFNRGEENEVAKLVVYDGETHQLEEVGFDTEKADDGHGIEPPEVK